MKRGTTAAWARVGSVLLEGGGPGSGWDRSLRDPVLWIRGAGPRLELFSGPAGDRGWLEGARGQDPGRGEPWARLVAIARGLARERGAGAAAFAGVLSYELGRRFERVPSRLPADSAAVSWDFTLGLYAPGSSTSPPPPPSALRRSRGGGGSSQAAAVPEIDRGAHAQRVEAIRGLIAAGTVYQANLTLRFRAPCANPDAAAAAFLRLRTRNPAPRGAFLALPDCTVVSASPETFLEVDAAGRVRSRPIKGTAPRAADPASDAAELAGLLASAKDRAELSMILDLVRNDLGRVCVPGSVDRGPRIRAEAHPSVWHLVGDVEGQLAPGRDGWDLIPAAFPPGSCIGAPKLRAMAVLEELERSRRGPYTGAIGWIGLDGTMSLSVAIRTMLFAGGGVEYGVGGGIVYESEAGAEWEEALLKGRALGEALRPGAAGHHVDRDRDREVEARSTTHEHAMDHEVEQRFTTQGHEGVGAARDRVRDRDRDSTSASTSPSTSTSIA